MKLTKQELLNKVNELSMEDESKIILLEDISDSFNDDNSNTDEFNEYKVKYEDLLTKYKERFLTSEDENTEDVEDENEENEIIDVKEI